MIKKFITITAALMLVSGSVSAQEKTLTREQILAMSTDDLSELPLEDLMQAVETLGVSSVDELFALIMNKQVSSASKEEESTFTSPLATTVITKDELRTYGATTIEDAFRLIPGMIVTQKTNGVYDIQVRGLNNIPDNNMMMYTENNNTLLMVDGRTVQNFVTGAIMMEMLPISIEDVERIEVVRGACAALYGMNAVTGVINIITEKPTKGSKTVSGSFQMGNHDTYVADVALRYAFNDKWSAGVSFNGQMRERPTSKLYVPGNMDFVEIQNSSAASSGMIKASSEYYDRLYKTETVTVVDEYTGDEYTYEAYTDEYKDDAPYHTAADGGFYSVEELQKKLRRMVYVGNYTGYDVTTGNFIDEYFGTEEDRYIVGQMVEDGTSLNDMFPRPGLARENVGLNGYLRFAPQPDITVNLTGGYQTSLVNTTALRQEYFSFNGRQSKTGYVNLDANIKDLHVMASYTGGPQNFAYGAPGYKMKTNNVNAQAEYDFHVGDFSLRPAVSWLYLKYKDYESSYTDNAGVTTNQYGILGGEATLTTISPSFRVDWKHNGWRAVAGVRGDHTSKPDKWNVAYQAELSKSINDRNFVRLVYGRSFRAPNMINTSANFVQSRLGMGAPTQIRYKGSDDADLMKIDNFEIGYRVQPNSRILVDAEAFFSHSEDYGSLVSNQSAVYLRQEQFGNLMGSLQGYLAQGGSPYDAAYFVYVDMASYSELVYKNLPYKVNQFGVSVNVDFVVSPKLILKLNANYQQTRIDEYYTYNYNEAVFNQIVGLGNAGDYAQNAVRDLVVGVTSPKYNLMGDDGSITNVYMRDVFGKASVIDFKAQYDYDNWSQDDQLAFQDALLEAWEQAALNGQATNNLVVDLPDGRSVTVDRPLTMRYGLRYGVLLENGEYVFDSSAYEEPKHSNKHIHKATPSVYGMFGAIYKPVSKLSIAAYCNYIGKRTYKTLYSTSYEDESRNKLDAKFTLNAKVGYSPREGMEIFLNANNLFNDDRKEFIHSDKIGGLYTVGVNFSF